MPEPENFTKGADEKVWQTVMVGRTAGNMYITEEPLTMPEAIDVADKWVAIGLEGGNKGFYAYVKKWQDPHSEDFHISEGVKYQVRRTEDADIPEML